MERRNTLQHFMLVIASPERKYTSPRVLPIQWIARNKDEAPMQTTRVTVKALFNHGPLLGVVDVVLDDCLVVKDIRIVECAGRNIVAMPCRKAVVRCTNCSYKNTAGANFCSQCGRKMEFQKIQDSKLYVDVVHPVTSAFRTILTNDVMAAYEAERFQRYGSGQPANVDLDHSSAVSSQFLRSVETDGHPTAPQA
jgi:DNA-binding cell septation regulator SpoVG